VFAEDEAELLLDAEPDLAALEPLVARRVAGEPLEYVLGWAEFGGLRVRVTPGVFVPRRRTELLLRLATEAASTLWAAKTKPRVLELCCGAAPVATALKVRLPEASVTAIDIDPDAVLVARENLEPLGGTVHGGDLFGPLAPLARFDVIVANAPYVPTAAVRNMPREAREHEHAVALDGGDDGLELHRRIAAEAAPRLAPGGLVLVETSRRQAAADRRAFEALDWRVELAEDDELDATAVIARRAQPAR